MLAVQTNIDGLPLSLADRESAGCQDHQREPSGGGCFNIRNGCDRRGLIARENQEKTLLGCTVECLLANARRTLPDRVSN